MMRDYRNMKLSNIVIEFIKFGAVGLSNTIIYLVIYYTLIHFGVQYIIANTAGFFVSVYNAYILNKKYVFKSKNQVGVATFGKVVFSYGFTYSMSTILLYFLVSVMSVSNLIAPILNLIITIPLNFILNKFWAFR